MMQAFRNAAKPVILVVTISFFAWLVFDLSGLGTSTGSIFASQSVGKVNGRSIDVRAFDQQVQNVMTQQQQQGASLGLDQIQEIRDQVWDASVRNMLLDAEFKKRGLSVSSDEVADAIRNMPLPDLQQAPTFQTNGQFDVEKYQRWLASAEGQQYVPGLEAQYRDQLLQAKLLRSVVSDVFISDATLWERYRDEREQTKVGMVRIDPATTVTDESAPVTAQEAEAYYGQHRDEFKREKSAFLSFLYVPRATVSSDSAAAMARALATRDEIAKGAPFDEVARRESSDSLSAASGGDLGQMKRTDLAAPVAAAAATLPLNTLSAPVLSQFGYHIIKVESRTGDSVRARHILIPIEVTGAHRDQLDKVADSLELLAAEKLDPSAIDTTARALGLTVRRVGPVTEGARVFVPEGGQVPDAGVWAFQAKPGEHSQIIEAPNAFYVFRLDSVQKAGVPPLSVVKAEVESKVRIGKKTEEVKRIAANLAKQVTGGTGLAKAAGAMGFEYREMGPFARLTSPLGAPTLIGTAFSLKQGEIGGPVTLNAATGDAGVYLFEGLGITPADSADFVTNLPSIRQQALQAAKRSRVQAYLAALRESAKVVDRRSEIYKTAAQTTAALPVTP